jgi:hypothetical protein
MHRLVCRAHCHERRDAFRSSLRELGGRHPVEDRISVRAVERFEERFGARVPAERFREVARHSRRLRPVVSALPSPIALGALDLCQSRRASIPPFAMSASAFARLICVSSPSGQ